MLSILPFIYPAYFIYLLLIFFLCAYLSNDLLSFQLTSMKFMDFNNYSFLLHACSHKSLRQFGILILCYLENDFTCIGLMGTLMQWSFSVIYFLFQELSSMINDLRKSLNLSEIIIINLFNNIKCICILLIGMIIVILFIYLCR